MKRTSTVFIALLLAVAAIPLAAQVEDGNGPGYGRGSGDGTGDCSGPEYYDPSTVTTLTGTITDVLGFICQTGTGNNVGNGMHYVFTTSEGESYYAMMGPFWFLDESGLELEVGTAVTFTGSIVTPYNDNLTDYNYLIVTVAEVDGTEYVLRSDDGVPEWAGDKSGLYYNAPAYDKGNQATIKGTVTNVRIRTRGENADAGLELKIRTRDNQRLRVFVGPQYYCEMQGFAVGTGEQVRIRGSVQGKDVVAREVVCTGTGQRLKVRDRQGNPLWVN